MGVAKKSIIQFHTGTQQKDNGSRIDNIFDIAASIGWSGGLNGKGSFSFPGGFSHFKNITIDFAGAGWSNAKMRGSRVLIVE